MAGSVITKGSVVAALDVGSSKIACFVGQVMDDEGSIEVVGIGHQASRGIENGTITDLSTAEGAIRHAVHAAEHMAASRMKGYPLREVILNVPGVHTYSHHLDVNVQISGQEITDNDVRRVLAKSQEEKFGEEQELIHTIPINYRVDGNDFIREPRGMYGQTLDVGIHMVTGNQGALRNMATCIERSHLDIKALCAAPYAAGLSCLVEDEKDLGCTVIDMGGGVTSMAVFQGGRLLYVDAIPLGGKHVSKDIAKGLSCSILDAERLKTLYGSAMAANSDREELINVPQIGEDNDSQPNHVPRAVLIGIIQPRLEEIFEIVRARLQDSGLGDMVGRRVVLTGGASQLPGLVDLAKLVLDKQVRIGFPIRLTGLAEAANAPPFTVVAGLLNYLTECTDEMPDQILANVEYGSIFERFKLWVRENW